MHTKIAIPLLAVGLALGGTVAFAADQPGPGPMGPGQHWRMDKKDMAARHANKCADRYARAVGAMAYLETRLALKSDQKSAFERWKDVVLASAKKRSDTCTAMTPPAKRPSLVEAMKRHETMLESRLEGLKAQMPALESLTAKLDQKQERVLAGTIHKMMRAGRGERGFGHRERGMRGPMRGPGPMRGQGPMQGPMQGPGPN